MLSSPSVIETWGDEHVRCAPRTSLARTFRRRRDHRVGDDRRCRTRRERRPCGQGRVRQERRPHVRLRGGSQRARSGPPGLSVPVHGADLRPPDADQRQPRGRADARRELGVHEQRLDARVQASGRRLVHRRDEGRRGRGEGEPRPRTLRALQHPPERAQVDHERHRGQSHDGAAHAGSRPGRAAAVRSRAEPRDDREPEGHRRPQRRPHAGTGRRQRVGSLQARVRHVVDRVRRGAVRAARRLGQVLGQDRGPYQATQGDRYHHRRPAHQRGACGRHQRGPGHRCRRAAGQAARRLQGALGEPLHAGDHAAVAHHEGQRGRRCRT